MNAREIVVPDIGDFKDVEVIELLVKEGDTVRREQSLMTVESDKASMEIPSPVEGTIKSLSIKLGDKVSQGTVIGLVLDNGVATSVELTPNETSRMQEQPAANDARPALAAVPSRPPVSTDAAPGPALAAADLITTVNVPDIGDFDTVEVIEVLVKPGDTVKAEQSLITVESDKASMEIPSSAAGVITELLVKLGDKVSKGTPLLRVQSSVPAAGGAAVAATLAPVSSTTVASSVVTSPAATISQPVAALTSDAQPASQGMDASSNAYMTKPHASPSVRAFARELGVNLSVVTGSGPKGRITRADVQAFVKAAVARATSPAAADAGVSRRGSGDGLQVLAWPKVDFAKFGPIETQPLTRIKKLSGPNLHRNWVMIPHVTQFDEADVTELEDFRKSSNDALSKQGVKLTMLAFVIKACVSVLKKYPAFNSSLYEQGDAIILKQYWNIGFAADTPQGLVVPVLKAADQKGVAQIAKEMTELSALARDGKLKAADMQGATFTISSLGGVGGTAFTPIINAPEVAILGLSKSQFKPVWDGKQFVPRLMLPLSLSYDHRVIDGAQAAKFTSELAAVLADMRRVLL